MESAIHAIIVSIASTSVLVLVYLFLYINEEKTYLGIWAVGWIFYVLRHIAEIFLVRGNYASSLVPFSLMFALISSFFILWGTCNFLERKIPPLWVGSFFICIIWIIGSHYFVTNYSFLKITFPIYLYIAAIFIWTGIVYLKDTKIKRFGRLIVGVSLVIWGIHKVDYPLIAYSPLLASFGYLLASALGLLIALGILIIYFQKTKDDLVESEERFRLLAENAKDVVFRFKLHPTIEFEYISPAATLFTGYSCDEFYEDSYIAKKFIHPEDYPIFKEKFFSNEPIVLRWKRKDGEELWTEMRNVVIYDNKGLQIAVQGIVRDITALKLAEHELIEKQEKLKVYTGNLEQINKELEQFAYIVSHDLKAPLRAISNLSQWIEEDLQEIVQKSTRKYLELLRGRVQRLENLIDGILNYSRVGKLNSEINNVDIERLILDIIDELDISKNINISLQSEMPMLRADYFQIKQVFANIIGNAVKHHHLTKGNIEISCKEEQDFYKFSIKDDGPGIAPQFHEKVFEIFQTLQSRDKVESTGIGLTIVKKILDKQGAEILLNSQEGQGANFIFTWPKI